MTGATWYTVSNYRFVHAGVEVFELWIDDLQHMKFK